LNLVNDSVPRRRDVRVIADNASTRTRPNVPSWQARRR
jgi:hypothetical protein